MAGTMCIVVMGVDVVAIILLFRGDILQLVTCLDA